MCRLSEIGREKPCDTLPGPDYTWAAGNSKRWGGTVDPDMTSKPKKTPQNSISEITRQEIFDWLRVSGRSWWGRIGEVDFLGRIFDLDDIPSYDSRYTPSGASS